MMRYYSTERPVTPGSFPKPEGNRVEQIGNFLTRTYVEDVHRQAWGYIDYEKPLDDEITAGYELVPVNATGCYGCINEYKSRDMDCCWNCRRNDRRKPDNHKMKGD